ncbi:hypothetical protein ACA910_010048 [Epithemia clementina (nom. ined.)]
MTMQNEQAEQEQHQRLPKIPQRSLQQYSGISADSVSMVGLGCSSFSTFFWTTEDWKRGSSHIDGASSSSSSASASAAPSSSWTVENLDPNHPIVQEWIDTIVYAITEAGITLLDTAPWYGHGTSEVVIGWAMERLQQQQQQQPQPTTTDLFQRDGIQINTKVGRYQADPAHQFDYSYETTIASVQRSVQRMQCHYIDVLQLHDPEFAPQLHPLLVTDTIPAMLQCRDELHLCRALGMTGYPLAVQHQLLQQTLELYPNRTVWNQALTYGHFTLHDTSLFNRTFITWNNGSIDQARAAKGNDCQDDRKELPHKPDQQQPPPPVQEETMISFATFCDRYAIRVLAAAPLSMGLLTPQGPPPWHPASPELRHACQAAVAVCQTASVDVVELALLFSLAAAAPAPVVPCCTIVGMKNIAQVQAAQRVALRAAKLDNPHQTKNNNNMVEHGTDVAKNAKAKNELDTPPSRPPVSYLMRLQPILTESEHEVLSQILDPTNGPFAAIWAAKKDSSSSSSDGGGDVGYADWDGLQPVRDFWKQVPNVDVEEWQASS